MKWCFLLIFAKIQVHIFTNWLSFKRQGEGCIKKIQLQIEVLEFHEIANLLKNITFQMVVGQDESHKIHQVVELYMNATRENIVAQI
jgi:hypothetical protein